MNTELSYDEKIDHIYRLLISLTDGEEDEELNQYYESVISYCEDIQQYLTLTQKGGKRQ